MVVSVELTQVEALAPAGAYRSLRKHPVTDVTGEPVGELSLVPVPYVSRTISALRKVPPLPPAERVAAMRRASDLLRTGVIGGLSRSEYEWKVSRVSGLGSFVVEQAVDHISAACVSAYESAQSARPEGAVDALSDARLKRGAALWMRKGDVFGVHAAGNHPAVHANWLEALALGYKVAVRPSRREPLTPFRLISALRDAGFVNDVAFLPGEYDAADELMRAADLSMVYGGDDVIAKYGARSDILPQGPGRSKILITRDVDWREYVDFVVDCASNGGGTGCVNATAIYVDGDARALATEVAARLQRIPTRRPEDKDAVLPVVTLESADAINRFLQSAASSSEAILGGDGIVDEIGDGSAVLRPAVHLVDSPTAQALRAELAFPCLWVSSWKPEDGIECFDDTLALTVLGADYSLAERLIARPSIKNVYLGATPTYWGSSGMPHDDYLGSFLMRSKAVVRDAM